MVCACSTHLVLPIARTQLYLSSLSFFLVKKCHLLWRWCWPISEMLVSTNQTIIRIYKIKIFIAVKNLEPQFHYEIMSSIFLSSFLLGYVSGAAWNSVWLWHIAWRKILQYEMREGIETV